MYNAEISTKSTYITGENCQDFETKFLPYKEFLRKLERKHKGKHKLEKKHGNPKYNSGKILLGITKVK